MAEGSRALFDETVRRRIALERYSTQRTREALRFLKSLEADLMGRVAQLREEAGTRSGRIRLASQERLLESVRDLYRETYAKLREDLSAGQRSLAAAEFAATAERFGEAAASAGLQVSTQQLTATAAFEIAAARPMQGALLKDWLRDLEPSHRKRIEQALRISFAEGESLQAATARLRGATTLNARGLEALIRTANTHIASTISEAVYDQYKDLIEGVEWVAVLDSRTTPICRARDGERWPVGEGPRPPAHVGCRSTTIPVLIGSEPLPRPTYGEWLKTQSAEVQNDILGPTRARLFRSGALTIDRFVDMKGKPLTLKELGALKPPKPPVLGIPDLDDYLARADLPEELAGLGRDDLQGLWDEFLSKARIPPGGRFSDVLHPIEERAMRAYTGSGYIGLNARARAGTIDQSSRAYGAIVKSALGKLPAERTPREVFRGVGGKAARVEFLEAIAGDATRVVIDPAFGSFSQLASVARDFAELRAGPSAPALGVIYIVAAPRRGADISSLSRMGADEAEWLFPPGQVFRVLSAERPTDGRWRGYLVVRLDPLDDVPAGAIVEQLR